MIAAALAVALSGLPQTQPWFDANAKNIAGIHNPSQRRRRARLFAQTIRDLQAQTHAASTVDARDARSVAAALLANRRLYRFAEVPRPAPKTWWERALAWLQERWNAIFKAFFGRARLSARAAGAAGQVLLALSIAAFLFMLGRLALQYGTAGIIRTSATPLQGGADPSALRALADRQANLGNYSRALECLFEAALCGLRGRGVLSDEESQTLGQLRGRVRAAEPGSYEAFNVIAAALTQAVYADVKPGRTDWERARGAYAEIFRTDERTHAA